MSEHKKKRQETNPYNRDERLNSQTSDHPLFSAFSRQVKILPLGPFFNPIELIDFTRPFRRWRNRRIMDEYINKILDDRFATRHQREKKKLVVDLALEYYLKEEKKMSNANAHQAKTLDPTFKKAATNHIKTFLFAGHDTTSSAICYAYHLLSKSPESLAKLRAELDNVLGTGSDAAARSISENPSILNQLPYTLAVIKETLRCYPAASTLREGKKGYDSFSCSSLDYYIQKFHQPQKIYTKHIYIYLPPPSK